MSDNKTNFARFLSQWMEREKISFEELFLNLQARTPLDRETLSKILSGEIQPDIYQLTFLGIVLTKEDGSQYSLRELTQVRDGINHNNECDNHHSNDHTHS